MTGRIPQLFTSLNRFDGIYSSRQLTIKSFVDDVGIARRTTGGQSSHLTCRHYNRIRFVIAAAATNNVNSCEISQPLY
jgi:hypothetical protein